MASMTTDSYLQGAVDQGAHLVLVTFNGSYHNTDYDTISSVWFQWDYADGSNSIEGPIRSSDGGTGFPNVFGTASYAYTPGQVLPGFQTQNKLTADKNYRFRAEGFFDIYGSLLGSFLYFKSYAVTATEDGVASASLITASTARITANFFPNTDASTATVGMEYRALGSGDWTPAPGGTSPYTGYLTQNIFRDLTGLTGSTIYEFRFSMTRNTSNAQTLNGTTRTFTTLASAPTVTTVAASSVSHNSATLNGSVDPNTLSVRVRFGWGTSDVGTGTWANYTSYQAFSGDGAQAFSAGISGLTASTLHFFRAFAEHPSPGFGNLVQPNNGTLSFTTSGDPAAEAAEAEMLPIQDFDRKYGVATTIYFVIAAPSGSSSNLFYTGAAVWAGAGECKISKDGAAFADTTNDPVQVGTQLYSLALTAAEMQCSQSFIILTELGATAARDTLLRVRTEWQMGNVDIDALTGTKTNTSAFKVTGHGSGHGLECIGGATGNDIDGIVAQHFARVSLLPNQAAVDGNAVKLDTLASATNDLYNGLAALVVSGTGVGQCLVIIDYDGTTKIATLDSTWVTPPVAGAQVLLAPASRAFSLSPLVELAAVPTVASSYGAMLQLIFQRFAYKITQTATVQTLFKADSSTALGTRSVSDDGTTQTITKIT